LVRIRRVSVRLLLLVLLLRSERARVGRGLVF
jgi:hypothetical protein